MLPLLCIHKVLSLQRLVTKTEINFIKGSLIWKFLFYASYIHSREIKTLPYFLGYKTDFFSFQNNPKDLDPSYKTDLDL